jgi:hypothetical protein
MRAPLEIVQNLKHLPLDYSSSLQISHTAQAGPSYQEQFLSHVRIPFSPMSFFHDSCIMPITLVESSSPNVHETLYESVGARPYIRQ